MKLFKRKILILGRTNISNYGDSIIADCCKYVIEKTAKENHFRAEVTLGDIYTKNPEDIKKLLEHKKKIVFPGGGMNGIKYNDIILDILDMLKKGTSVYFNAIGIRRINPRQKNEMRLEKIFNHPLVKQITTRGCLEQTKTYVHTEKTYPVRLVFDPAIWANETYQVKKVSDSDVIGLGVIRPEIFEINGNTFSVENVLQMYSNIIRELEKRNYRWKLFTNGMGKDYTFGLELLKYLGLDPDVYIGENVKSNRQLVEKISGFKGIIAARMHANIIATSLQVPSVGLVWNDKMNLFAQIIGCEERYIQLDKLLDAQHIVDTLDNAMAEGYDTTRIENMKSITVDTIKNILK